MTNDQMTTKRDWRLSEWQSPAPGPDGGAPTALQRVKEFDLPERVADRLARDAQIEPTEDRRALANLQTAARSVYRMWRSGDRSKKRRAMVIFFSILGVLAVIVGLLVTGVLGDAYRWVYTQWPGRPWTHVMRDYPLIYLGIFVVVVVGSFMLAHKSRWGRALLIEVAILLGFLGGHVFW